MGSLMAGWDSPILDPKAVTYQRNMSSTKEEIEAYWRSNKRTEEEHLTAILDSTDSSQASMYKESGGLQRSNSLPLTDRKGNFFTVDSETVREKLTKKRDWWIGSNWAFLNEPPVIGTEGPSYKYASQHHVTRFGSPNQKPIQE